MPLRQAHPASVLLTLMLVASLSAGCAREDDNGAPPDDRAAENTPSDEAQRAEQNRPGVSAREMIDQALNPRREEPRHPFLDDLRQPARLEREAVENRHVQGQIDTIRTYYYEGLRLRVYDPSDGGGEIVTDVRIDSPGYDHPLDFDIGAPRAKVRESLGEPEEVRDSDLRYLIGDDEDAPAAAPNYLDVRIADGRVSRLTWRFYYD